jgi:hypothetical protein
VNTLSTGGNNNIFHLSQISGGYFITFARSAFRFGFFFSHSAFLCSAFSYIYIIHQGRQSVFFFFFLRVGGPLLATKDGRLCEPFLDVFALPLVLVWFFVFYHWEAV